MGNLPNVFIMWTVWADIMQEIMHQEVTVETMLG